MNIVRIHPFTGELNEREINVTQEQLATWKGGVVAQKAFPHLNADEREFIMTGITDWDERFQDA